MSEKDVQPVAWAETDGYGGIEWGEEGCFSNDPAWIEHPIPLYEHPPAAAVQDLVAALMIIAGKQRCVDSLMSNVDIALGALKRWEGLK